MGRRASLKRLIQEQAEERARERRTQRLPAEHSGMIRESEMSREHRYTAEAVQATRHYRQPRQWAVYLEGCDAHQWDAVNQMDSLFLFDPHDEHAADHIDQHWRKRSCPIHCPVCMDRPLPEGWYCSACDRAGLDPIHEDESHPFRYKGYSIDQFPEWLYINAYGLTRTPTRPPAKSGTKGQ